MPTIIQDHYTSGNEAAFRVEDLSTLNNETRNQIITLICCAVYDTEGAADGPGATLISDLLRICGGSEELLAATLQAPFIEGRSPLRWAVGNSSCPQSQAENTANEGQTSTDPPPVIVALLDRCGSELLPETIRDIELACCEKEDNELYQHLSRHSLLRNHRVPLSFGEPALHVSRPQGTWAVDFDIPQFPERMLMCREVRVHGVVDGNLFTVHFTAQNAADGQPNWSIQAGFSEGVQPPSYVNFYSLKLCQLSTPGAHNVEEGGGVNVLTYQVVGTASLLRPVAMSVDLLRTRNIYIDNSRRLRGKITLHFITGQTP